jgi:hypothetical protein
MEPIERGEGFLKGSAWSFYRSQIGCYASMCASNAPTG